jgi:hypothetical protein
MVKMIKHFLTLLISTLFSKYFHFVDYYQILIIFSKINKSKIKIIYLKVRLFSIVLFLFYILLRIFFMIADSKHTYKIAITKYPSFFHLINI